MTNTPINFIDPSGHYKQGLSPGTKEWFDDIQSGERWTTDQVKQLQRDLNAWGFKGVDGNQLSVDGGYGANTRYAHEKYFEARNAFINSGHSMAQWEAKLRGGQITPPKANPGTNNNPSKTKCSGVDWNLFWDGASDFGLGVAGLIAAGGITSASPLTAFLTVGLVVDSIVSIIDGQVKILDAIGGKGAVEGAAENNYSVIETLFGKKVAKIYNAAMLLTGIHGTIAAIRVVAKSRNYKTLGKLLKEVYSTFKEAYDMVTG